MTANDSELLRQYVRERSEEAFAELVGRHLRLVYAAALRQLNGDSLAAGDVTQAVFAGLAAKAPCLLRHTSLAAWLYTSTRFEAAKSRRSAERRLIREHAAHAMNEILRSESPEYDWTVLRPLLDDAMDDLSPSDREVVLWRYFEQCPFASIALRLGLKENAARMRVERALDKLRAGLARRGITSSAIALAAALAAHAMEEPPPGLAGRVVRGSVAAGAAGGLAWWLVSAKAKLAVTAVGVLTVAGIVLSSRPNPSATLGNSADAEPGTGVTASPPPAGAELPPAATSQLALPASAVPSQGKPFEFRLSLVTAEDTHAVVDGEVSCSLETGSSFEIRNLRSDAGGMVRLQIPENTKYLRLATEIDGLADTRLEWRPERGEAIPHDYVLTLTPGVTLGGYVMNGQTNPIGDAEVVAYNGEPTDSPRPECHVAGLQSQD